MILRNLGVDIPECICERTTKFRWKILSQRIWKIRLFTIQCVTAPPAPSWNKGTPYALIRASGPRCGQRERREKPKDSSLRQADLFRDGSRSPSCRGLRRQGQEL